LTKILALMVSEVLCPESGTELVSYGEMKMAKRSKKGQKSQAKLQGFVVVAFAKDWEQAREYETLLRVSDIPAVVNEQEDHALGTTEITVMVPEDFLDEAHVIIESQDSYDDFYDYALEDEDEADFEADAFDEEF
jgi:hypothetical protein